MKKTIKRLVEQEVDVCDRCEIRDTDHRFSYRMREHAHVAKGREDDTVLELCDTCRAVIENAMTMTRRKRKAAAKDVTVKTGTFPIGNTEEATVKIETFPAGNIDPLRPPLT